MFDVSQQNGSPLATKWINNSHMDYHRKYIDLILDYKLLLTRQWEAHSDHIWREADSCADLQAKRGASQREREILYDTCPTFWLQCLYWDTMGWDQWRVLFYLMMCIAIKVLYIAGVSRRVQLAQSLLCVCTFVLQVCSSMSVYRGLLTLVYFVVWLCCTLHLCLFQ